MAGPESAPEGITLWQGLGYTGAAFAALLAAVVTRIIGKKDDTEAAGDAHKHVVLEQATLADAAPFTAMAKDVKAIRELLEEQVELQKERFEQDEKRKTNDRIGGLEEQIRRLIEGGAQHKPGRPLQD